MYLFGTTLSGRTPPVVEPRGGIWVQSVLQKERDVSIMVNTVTLMAVIIVPALVLAAPIAMLSSVRIESTPSTTLLGRPDSTAYGDGDLLRRHSARCQLPGRFLITRRLRFPLSGLVSVVESAGDSDNRLYWAD